MSVHKESKRYTAKKDNMRTGVASHRGRWRPYVWKGGKKRWLGVYASLEEALRVRDVEAIRCYGPNAEVNVLDEDCTPEELSKRREAMREYEVSRLPIAGSSIEDFFSGL